MKSILRRQLLALMLGVTAASLIMPMAFNVAAYADDDKDSVSDSDASDGDSSSDNSDDGSHHDSNDDGASHDVNDDGAGHDANDDGPNHDQNDANSGADDDSDDVAANSAPGIGNADCAVASVNCSKKKQK